MQDLRNDGDGDYPSISTIVLLHEICHHFLISTGNFAMPRWLNEGRSGSFFFQPPASSRRWQRD